MGFAIANPEKFERFALVGRRAQPISTWPKAPATPEEPESAWLLVGFMLAGADEIAVYGLLTKDLRQRDGWADRVETLAGDALNQHEKKALTKAQIRDALKAILDEVV